MGYCTGFGAWPKALAAGLLLISLMGSAAAQSVANASATQDYMMVALEDTKNTSDRTLNAQIVIDAPPHLVWQTITNYEQFDKFLPGYQKSDLVTGSGNTKILDVLMKVASFLPAYQSRLRVTENRANYKLTLDRLGGDFKKLNATYKLLPQSNGKQTLLIYNLQIDPGLPMPAFTVNKVIKANAEKTLKAVKTHAIQLQQKSMVGQR
jgi:ribosome-associated toxin RatA of RatAB toxin-antitoxin module